MVSTVAPPATGTGLTVGTAVGRAKPTITGAEAGPDAEPPWAVTLSPALSVVRTGRLKVPLACTSAEPTGTAYTRTKTVSPGAPVPLNTKTAALPACKGPLSPGVDGVRVGETVKDGEAVGDMVGVKEGVPEGVAVLTGVQVQVGLAVRLGVAVRETVGVTEKVSVGVAVRVALPVGVAVNVDDPVGVAV